MNKIENQSAEDRLFENQSYEDLLFDEIRGAFLAEGRAFPVTEQEVEDMERFLEEEGCPEIPEHLQAENLAKREIYRA